MILTGTAPRLIQQGTNSDNQPGRSICHYNPKVKKLKIKKSAHNRFEIQHAGVTADIKFVFFVIIISINTTSKLFKRKGGMVLKTREPVLFASLL